MEPIVKVTLTNGRWAMIYREMLHKTFRQHQAVLQRYLVPTGNTVAKMSDIEAGKKPPKIEYTIDFAKLDMYEINEIYLLNQVVEWSYGPVTRTIIEEQLTRDDYLILVGEMDRLYQPSPLQVKSNRPPATGWVKRFIARFS